MENSEGKTSEKYSPRFLRFLRTPSFRPHHPSSVLSGSSFLSFSACLIAKFGSWSMTYSIAREASELCLETKHYLESWICWITQWSDLQNEVGGLIFGRDPNPVSFSQPAGHRIIAKTSWFHFSQFVNTLLSWPANRSPEPPLPHSPTPIMGCTGCAVVQSIVSQNSWSGLKNLQHISKLGTTLMMIF